MNLPDLSMGGYGFYVWGSYIFAAAAIASEVWSLSRRKKALVQERKRASVIRGSMTNETTS